MGDFAPPAPIPDDEMDAFPPPLPPVQDDEMGDFSPPNIPDDDSFGPECQSSHDCSDFVTEMCVDGRCTQRECGPGVGGCGEGEFCSESMCLQLDCSQGQECSEGYVCVNGTCNTMIDEDDDFEIPLEPLPTMNGS